MNKKLFIAATLLFAIMGSVSKAAPAMLEARGNYMAANDTIIDENAIVLWNASYPGGPEALYAFIYKNTVYPQIALETETQGEAVVEFCVKEDGTIGEVFMLKSLSPECDKALMDAVRKLKRFLPAKEKGKPVPSWFKMSVSFNLSEDNDNDKPIREIKSDTGKVVGIISEFVGRVQVQHIEYSHSRID